MDPQHIEELITCARTGDTKALGELLERFRMYLRRMAQQRLDQKVSARLMPDDIVQQTFLEAQRDFGSFQGDNRHAFSAWLRRIHENNIVEVIRKQSVARKRSVRKETSIDDSDAIRPKLRDTLPSTDPTPSGHARLAETAERVAKSIAELPDDQQKAVWLKHFEGESLRQIALRLDRSEVAVASLLHRGIRKLRHLLSDERQEKK